MQNRLSNRLSRYLAPTLVVAALLLLLHGLSTAQASQASDTALTFTGVEAIAQSEPCTADYTFDILGTTVCSVYAGSIKGGVAGKAPPAAAIINLTVTRLDVTDSRCFPMYVNVQFAGTSESQTLFGFGSLCGPSSTTPPVQSGAKLTSSGGYSIAESSTGASGFGQFSGTFTPVHGVAGDKLVMVFSPLTGGSSQ